MWHYKCIWVDGSDSGWSLSAEWPRIGEGDIRLLLEEIRGYYGKRYDGFYVIGNRLYEHFFENDSVFMWEWRERDEE